LSKRLPFFPIPEPGETVYSVICRFAERTGLPAGRILGALTGKHTDRLATALPTHILPIASKMPDGHPWRDAEQIIAGHTTLPYFLYFRPDVRNHWIGRFAGCGSSYYLQAGIGLAAYPCQPVPRHPRYCRECIEEDLQLLGYSFYRREHQLPCVAVCRTHGGILHEGCAVCGPYPLKGQAFRMAGRCRCADGIIHLLAHSDPPADLEPLLWLARESAFMVDSPGTKHRSFHRILKDRAVKAGLGYQHGIDHAGFARAIESRFSPDVLQFLGIRVWRGNQPAPWVQAIMHSLGAHRKPAIRILLAIGALFDSVEEFELSDRGTGSDGASFSVARTSEPKWKTDLPALLRTSDTGAFGLAEKLGISVKTVAFEIRRQGLSLPLSRQTKNKIGEEKLNAVRRDLRKGMGRTDICRRHGCSEWTVLMVELDQPALHEAYPLARRGKNVLKHRQALLAYLAGHPCARRIDIHREPSLRGTRSYLLKYDKEWIESRMPSKRRSGPPKGPRATRIDWESIDRRKAEELERAVDGMLAQDGDPAWLSKSRLLGIAGLKEQYHRYPNRLPLVGDVLRRRAKTRTQHEIHRLEWAVKQIARGGGKLSLKSLLRVVNMKPDIIRSHESLIADLAVRFGVETERLSVFKQIEKRQ
jgi:hypothetical protein